MTTQLPTSITSQIDHICSQSLIMPVITINTAEQALPLAEALLAGGINVLEITLRSEYGLTAIAELRKKLPEAWIGAGTVTNRELLKQAQEAGAQFIVTPGSTDDLLAAGVTANIPLLPGVATGSELMMGLEKGYQRFKFFPASINGGTAALKAFSGPFGQAKFCPTGGINLDNAAEYLALNNVMCIGGSWVVPKDAVENGDWKKITTITKESIERLS
ncbi:bifunctional 4-hydroxy-2-oxoglutarate aldolase/2-dehydro-3-deoxy-phosphogluconate aldolase [Endozoicomonas sp. SM1973]|uniref:2-dehydro-3-deoxy-phosphogluconate aldolase n=1 Tax=Spartinivicinus marinus TaxID=2994442 RepID=A0A853IKL5_9GAMM|nr:bifunctional 4-hydroxy-2-oxoglutarate aldolase/2-dehydro-3-deoxy-phosphogluconate aldolase [Spartinivicinus marinus]MCX4027529.1 bifunctional 4-hydroxy-2-oxoglutarate aldolase/2-dehydro-3-deoxy-phosphogluconate aldolase [Spartinivicinus marinus]NYZ68226.1 bifunctional 4-hydroxy-2-oxoglutarate aldolase/2-dehydro-3-deoxy-phosphogluconate aldolase [Spartinivicinus marinus]